MNLSKQYICKVLDTLWKVWNIWQGLGSRFIRFLLSPETDKLCFTYCTYFVCHVCNNHNVNCYTNLLYVRPLRLIRPLLTSWYIHTRTHSMSSLALITGRQISPFVLYVTWKCLNCWSRDLALIFTVIVRTMPLFNEVTPLYIWGREPSSVFSIFCIKLASTCT